MGALLAACNQLQMLLEKQWGTAFGWETGLWVPEAQPVLLLKSQNGLSAQQCSSREGWFSAALVT